MGAACWALIAATGSLASPAGREGRVSEAAGMRAVEANDTAPRAVEAACFGPRAVEVARAWSCVLGGRSGLAAVIARGVSTRVSMLTKRRCGLSGACLTGSPRVRPSCDRGSERRSLLSCRSGGGLVTTGAGLSGNGVRGSPRVRSSCDRGSERRSLLSCCLGGSGVRPFTSRCRSPIALSVCPAVGDDRHTPGLFGRSCDGEEGRLRLWVEPGRLLSAWSLSP